MKIKFYVLGVIFPLALLGCQTTYYSPQVVDATGKTVYSSVNRRVQDVRNNKQQNSNYGVVKPYVENSKYVNSSDDTYLVSPGDTLYSIAFRYGQDYHDLAAINNIQSPYNIEVGQVLNLRKSVNTTSNKVNDSGVYIVKAGDCARSVARDHGMTLEQLVAKNHLAKPYNIYVGQKLNVLSSKNSNIVSKNQNVPVAGKTDNNASQKPVEAKTVVVSGKTRKVAGIVWQWPAKGQIVKRFSSSEHANNGIDIAGTRGRQVVAAAAGQVVYAGNALRGYGNLIIVNHENEYLSAYAHNESLLVKEGQTVKRGQVIAKMGSTDSDRVKLHFEVRHQGVSVNPEKYLPVNR